LDFTNEEEFLAEMEKLKAASTFQSNVTINGDDRIFVLVTCTQWDKGNEIKYIVCAKVNVVKEKTMTPDRSR